MENEYVRLHSFFFILVNMSRQHLSLVSLAREGFYWCAQSGQVKCFCCGRSYSLKCDLTQHLAHETTCRRDERNITFQDNHDISPVHIFNASNSARRDNMDEHAAIGGAVGGCEPETEIGFGNQAIAEDTEVTKRYDAVAGHPNPLGDGGTQADCDSDLCLRKRLLLQENKYLKQRRNCKRCREQPRDCIFLPCRCVVVCHNCKDFSPTCIDCEKKIDMTFKIYF